MKTTLKIIGFFLLLPLIFFLRWTKEDKNNYTK